MPRATPIFRQRRFSFIAPEPGQQKGERQQPQQFHLTPPRRPATRQPVHVAYLVSVWLHILAAAVWVGGMVFLAAVLVPVSRTLVQREVATLLIQQTGVRFRWIGWTCFVLLLLSGVFNLIYRGFDWTWSVWQSPFGRVLTVKLLLVVVILCLSVLHDFIVGPQATALGQASPASPQALQRRRQASWLGRVNLLLSLVVLALGVALTRGWPW